MCCLCQVNALLMRSNGFDPPKTSNGPGKFFLRMFFYLDFFVIFLYDLPTLERNNGLYLTDHVSFFPGMFPNLKFFFFFYTTYLVPTLNL